MVVIAFQALTLPIGDIEMQCYLPESLKYCCRPLKYCHLVVQLAVTYNFGNKN